MTTKQVEAMEAIKSDGHVLQPGDRVTVPEQMAARWCGAGWAKADGVPTGQRRVVRAVVAPHGTGHAHAAAEVDHG